MDKTKEMMEVMAAYVNGAVIESKEKFGNDDWQPLIKPSWDWYHCDYRIKPASVLRPYNDTTEMIQDYKARFGEAADLMWIQRENMSGLKENFLIIAYGKHWITIDGNTYGMLELLNSFTYMDGSPVGVPL